MKPKIIIPARLDSLRLPRKLMLPIKEIPMIEHVRIRCEKAVGSDNVYVATGDDEIVELVKSSGGQVIKTEMLHENGTSRVREAARFLGVNDIIIVQGDEPLIDIENIRLFSKKMMECNNSDVFCAVTPIIKKADVDDVNIVKCCTNWEDRILFIFRKSPFINLPTNQIKKIQGVIGFRGDAIMRELTNKQSIGLTESIEQLVLLENGLNLRQVEFEKSAPSVNTLAEYEKMLELFEI